jgi:hypothetical protein
MGVEPPSLQSIRRNPRLRESNLRPTPRSILPWASMSFTRVNASVSRAMFVHPASSRSSPPVANDLSAPVSLEIRMDWNERWGLVFIEAWLGFVGVLVTLMFLYILRGESDWWVRNPLWDAGLAFTPIEAVAVGWLLYRFDGSREAAITIDSMGISVDTRRRGARHMGWDDPRLRVSVFVRGVATNVPRSALVWGGRFLIPATPITESSAQALLTEARRHTLKVSEVEYGWGRWRKRSTRVRA